MNKKNRMKFFLVAMMIGGQVIHAAHSRLIEADPSPKPGYDYRGFPYSFRGQNQCPLHLAVSCNDLLALKKALQRCNINEKDMHWGETALYRVARFAGDYPISSTRDMTYAILQTYPNRRLLEEPGNVKNRTPATELYRNLYNTCSLEQKYKNNPLYYQGKSVYQGLEDEYGQQCRDIRDLILDLRKEGHLK